MDKISKLRRSWNMSRIKSKNTSPELLVRKKLFSLGYRYRIHYPIPGKPDVVFLSKKLAVFINGCFWHNHGCSNSVIPKTNTKFWKKKIIENKKRDKKNQRELKELGWESLIIWECEIKTDLNSVIEKIKTRLRES